MGFGVGQGTEGTGRMLLRKDRVGLCADGFDFGG